MREYIISPHPWKTALYFKSRSTDGLLDILSLLVNAYHHGPNAIQYSERTQKRISQQRLLKSVHYEKTQKPSHIMTLAISESYN